MRLAKAAVSLLVLWALAWAVVPGLVKRELEKAAGEQLGRKVSLGAVSFRPWSLELGLDDLQIADAAGATPQLQIGRIFLDLELQSLVRWAPVVDELRIDGLRLKLAHRGDGRYDVDDIVQRLAAASAGRPASAPPSFALYNVALTDASLDFVDEPVGKTHQVRDLTLTIPFLSTLASKRDVLVEPRLAFRLDGGHFDSAAQTTPFAPSHKSAVTLRLADLDVRPYLPYLPKDLPLSLQAGVLGADLRLAFEQATRSAVQLSGTVELKNAHIADQRRQEVLAFDALHLVLEDVRPLEQVVKLASVELSAPRLQVRRDKSGRLELLDLAATRTNAAAGKAKAATPAGPGPWQIELRKLAVHGGRVFWRDDATTPGARLEARDLALQVADLGLPWRRPAKLEGSLALVEGAGPPRNAKPLALQPARVAFKGDVSEQSATVTADVQDLALALVRPYAAQFLEPALAGSLSTQVGLQWQAPNLQLQLPRLVVSQLQLGQPSMADRSWPLAWARLELQDVQIEPARRSVALGKVALTQPTLALERGRDQRWMFEHWLKSGSAGPMPASAPAPATTPADKPWRVAVGEFSLDGGNVRYVDRATVRPVLLNVSALNLKLQNLATDSAQPGALKLAALVRSRRGDPGKLDFNGRLALQPLTLQGRLTASDLPLHALSPYLGDRLNVALLRADAGFRGDVRYAGSAAGPTFKLSGDALLEDVGANSLASAEAAGQELPIGQEVLSWKALSLRGLAVALAPGQATRVSVAETALTDFFARVVINEQGRINLQDLIKPAAPAETPPASPSSAVAASAPAPLIEMGPISLVNGRVQFSDRFIKPSYSADLTEVAGRLGAFSSAPATGDAAPALADLELRGRAEGTASVEIQGKLNPLAKPLALDIQGKMRDLELSPLSPYSVKYAGHGIERGKLAMDVSYRVQPDGQLVATNKLVLNQLTFGDQVEGAPASLPVRLAVALLADRNGVIDVDLPISGSLNDPEFRLGPIFFKALLNLIAKAITSPFSLLASAFGGGGEELAQVAFAAGSPALDAAAQAGLDKVAGAMQQRPVLDLTVAGTASLDAEREAFKREQLLAMMQAEKRRAAVVAGAPAEGATPVAAAERPQLLKEVYRRAKIPKPRNLIGLAKDLPPAEMEALLLASIPVTEEHMRELALARGVAVKDYLLGRGLPAERLFLGAAKLAAPDAKWTPRAELHLATR